MIKRFALPLLLLMSLVSFAQTTYSTTVGHTYSYNAWEAFLPPSGSGYFFMSPNTYGTGCYYGQCSDWRFQNFTLSYSLPNGLVNTLYNFSGSANFSNQSNITVEGTASDGTYTYTVFVAWKVFCQRGCIKEFKYGSITVQ